jgi:hypothetical protein
MKYVDLVQHLNEKIDSSKLRLEYDSSEVNKDMYGDGEDQMIWQWDIYDSSNKYTTVGYITAENFMGKVYGRLYGYELDHAGNRGKTPRDFGAAVPLVGDITSKPTPRDTKKMFDYLINWLNSPKGQKWIKDNNVSELS